MGWWKADPPAEALSPSPSPSPSAALPSSHPQASSLPASDSQDFASSCPVDPKTRAVWLQKHTKFQPPGSAPGPPMESNMSHVRQESITASISSPTSQCSSEAISQSPSRSDPTTTKARSLSHDRVISSIPRAFPHQPPSPPSSSSSSSTSTPSNSESETGPHRSGNWIYPSEHQFFTAVLRKHNPQTLSASASPTTSAAADSSSPTDSLAQTIPSIIPIHNAVNERAWTLIQQWERPFSPSPSHLPPAKKTPQDPMPCTGPKLLSFRGLGSGPTPSGPSSGLPGLLSDYLNLLNPTTTLSPKARWNALRGYQVPFDRHDWVVERCGGQRVEYVIDFYQGRSSGSSSPGLRGGWGGRQGPEEGMPGRATLDFYLDVRPKLNSWEGVKTRASRLGFGLASWGGGGTAGKGGEGVEDAG